MQSALNLKEEKKKKKGILEKMSETQLYPIMREMGHSDIAINQFQSKRIVMTVAVAFIFAVAGLFLMHWFYFAALIMPPLFWLSKYKTIQVQYQMYRFKREMEFTKFIRLLIPYLKRSNGQQSLYTVFNKIIRRMKHEADKRSLSQLMVEMSDNPDSVQPFIDFAKRASGNKRAIIFMTTIFHYRQSTFDMSVINELGQEASTQLMEGIQEIINSKLSRLTFYPMKLVYPILIVILGFAAGMLFDTWMTFGI